MSWLLGVLIFVAIAALTIFLFRKRIKAYVLSKLMAYASKKMKGLYRLKSGSFSKY